MKIRKMKIEDKADVIEMMREFYTSPAVLSNGSEEIFEADFSSCVGECPFLDGYVFEEDGGIEGYAMVSKGFSTESGKMRIWIEDIFVKEKYRGCGFGTEFFRFIGDEYPNCVIRLDVEEENEKAVKMYLKNGFEVLPYMEMIKNQ